MSATPRALRGLAALLLLCAPLPAQTAPEEGSFAEYLEVRVVDVELFAVDRNGEPVDDLRRDEIRVYEDGEPVELTYFRPPLGAQRESATAGAGGSARSGAADVASPVRLVVFVDNLNTGPASRTRLIGQALEVMEEGLRPGDEVMVASFDGSLRIELAFSRDRKALRRALTAVADRPGDRLVAGLRDRRALEDIQWETESNADGPCVFVGQLARNHADEASHQVQRTLAALEQFIGSLAGVPGRKVLLHVSDGIPLLPGAEAWAHAISLCDGSGASQGVPGATLAPQPEGNVNRFDPRTATLDMLSYDTTEQWRRLAAQAASHRVVFYPLYAAGLPAPTHSDAAAVRGTQRAEVDRTANHQDTLSILADETGGTAELRNNDFRSAIRAAIDESLTSYELTYASPARGDGDLHAIRVEVDRPGVRLRYRKSYQAKAVQNRVEDGVLSSLFYGLEQNPLGARIEVVPAGDRIVDGRMRVEVHLLVPLERLTLLPDGDRRTGLFTAFVAARAASGDATPVGRRTIPVQVPAEATAASGQDFRYVVEMEVAAEAGTVAVALRDEVGGETSYLTAAVEPPGRGGV